MRLEKHSKMLLVMCMAYYIAGYAVGSAESCVAGLKRSIRIGFKIGSRQDARLGPIKAVRNALREVRSIPGTKFMA